MRVLVISAAFPPQSSGEATNAYHLCERLAARGLDVHVLASKGHTGASDRRITVHDLMRTWSWSEASRLTQFLRRNRPDVVYLMYLGWIYNFQFMSTFIPTIAKLALPGVRVITRFENVSGAGPQTNSTASRVLRRIVASCDLRGNVDYQFGTLLRDSDNVIILSARHEEILEPHLAGVGRKCVLIPPPANMRMSTEGDSSRARGRLTLKVGATDFVLAYIGFVYPGKGIETLLQSFEQVCRARSNVRLAIIGGGLAREFPDQPNYLDDMHALAARLGIADRVIWTGDYSSDSDEASTYLRAADLCVLPFDTGVKLNNSSFSSVAAHGRPIVTTQDDKLEPQFVHQANVFLCPPKSADAMARAIETVMDDKTLRDRLTLGSLQLAQQWYAWDTAIEKTVSLFAAASTAPDRLKADEAAACQPISR
jgi:glycosyltransferase involved in cell wall biosynthesis